MAGKGQQVGQVANRREGGVAHQLHREASPESRQIELHRLRPARKIGHAENRLVFILAHVGEDLAVAGTQKLQGAAAKGLVRLAYRDKPLHPVEQRGGRAALRFDIDRFIAVERVHDRRQVEPLRIGFREACVAVRTPLHRRAYPIAIAKIDIVAHGDLVAVVDDGGAGHRQQQAVHQLDHVRVVVHQRRQPPADADIDAHARVRGKGLIHVVTLAVGDHLQGQLVVVAQKDRPLAALRDIRGLRHDLGDGMAVLLGNGHVHARHQRKVIGHVAFVAIAEIVAHVLGPLVGLSQEQAVLVMLVDHRAHLLDHFMGLGQVFVIGALAHAQVRNGVEAQAVHPHVEPKAHHADDGLYHFRVVVVEVRLVGEKTMPVIGLGLIVPLPVGGLGVGKDDPRLLKFHDRIAPHIELALARSGRRLARGLKPGVLVGGVVDHQLGNDTDAAPMRLVHEFSKIAQRAIVGMHIPVVGDVVAVVTHRRGVEGQQPDGVDAEVLHVVELFEQAAKIPAAVVVGISKGLDVQLIDNRVLVPQGIGYQC